MDQLISASLSHTHYWYEVGMLEVPVVVPDWLFFAVIFISTKPCTDCGLINSNKHFSYDVFQNTDVVLERVFFF